MNREDAAREVKSRYTEFLHPAKKKIKGQQTYICPLCGNGTGKDGDGLVLDPKAKNPYTLHCFKCSFHGDIVDLYQQQNNCSTGEAFRALYDYFGITVENDRTEHKIAQRKEKKMINTPLDNKIASDGLTEAFNDVPKFMGYYKECKSHITDNAAQAYLSFRGLSKETAARYRLGYDTKTGYLIIPVSNSYYIARNTDTAAQIRYRNPAGASIELFNKKALYNEAGRPVFITEGAIDALSIIEAGGEAVGLNSISNTGKLLKDLESQRTSCTLILCLDNDEAGKKKTAELAEGLRGLNIAYVTGDICGQYKDPNEALTADQAAFIEAVKAAERAITRPENTADYIRRSMSAEIEALKEQCNRKTGFSNLDAEAGSIYAGLYAVGGISSVGKTTFISQLADQMAEQGQHVLFFSMEQSRLEMVSKSISRQTAKDDPDRAVNSLQIRTGATGESIRKATEEYLQKVGDRISVIEGNFNCTVSFIRDYTKTYIDHNGGIKPVVIIDYLQVLTAERDPETGRKTTDTRQIVDYNVTELKRISRALDVPVFVISSFNRSNYLTPVDYEAFKESGGVEYTADVVWGLQLAIMNDDLFNSEKKIKEKREKVSEAKAAVPRDIELVCLKNRYGKSRYTVQFTYYPQYDYFQPVNNAAGSSAENTGSKWDNVPRR